MMDINEGPIDLSDTETSSDEYGSEVRQPKRDFHLLSLKEIIIPPNVDEGETQEEKIQNILTAFNEHLNGRSFVTKGSWFGELILPSQVRLVHRNHIPQLVPYTERPMRRKISLKPGTTTRTLGVYDQDESHYGDFGHYVVNVPPGNLAKATIGQNRKPILLGEGTHVIKNATFQFNSFVDISDEYIQHDTIHILRIPRGKIAEIWIGATPYFLESRADPYVFNDPLFRLGEEEPGENYCSADRPLITHGALKRLLPRTGSVAITYDHGILKIIEPTENSHPIIISSGMHTVEGFLDVTSQTRIFPSTETKQRQRAEGHTSPNVLSFRTVDSLEFGVELLVVYRISNPAAALTKLRNEEGIERYIEKTVTADMNQIVQRCNSSEFLKTNQTVPEAIDDESPEKPLKLQTFAFFQDEMRSKLVKDFRGYGLELVRLNIEKFDILNRELAAKMAQNSLQTATMETQRSLLETEFEITKRQAEQNAERQRIEIESSTQSLQIEAQARLDAARLDAQATEILGRAEASTARAMQEVDQARAETYRRHPELLELDRMKYQAQALAGINTMVLPPENVPMFYQLAQSQGFFGERSSKEPIVSTQSEQSKPTRRNQERL